MANILAISQDCESISAGTYAGQKFVRVLLPKKIKKIEKGAFDKELTCSFWVVNNSYAARRIANLCPKSKLVLFQTGKEMRRAWRNFKDLKAEWNRVRAALPMEDIYEVMYSSGWTFEEAASRCERAFLSQGVTAREYAARRWRNWFTVQPEADTTGTWIAWRQQELAKLDKGMETGELEYDSDLSLKVPVRISARKYAGMKRLARQIRKHEITLKTIFDYMDMDMPASLKDKQKHMVPKVAYSVGNLVEGGVLFCRVPSDARPEAAKKAGAVCVFGPASFKKGFVKAGIPYVVCPRIHNQMIEMAAIWREQFPDVKTICITGTVGKTTTTELVNHVALSSFNSHCIWVNRNTAVQCSEHIQNLDEHTEVMVQECSGAGVGQMERSTSVLRPDIFVVTNVGTGHIGLHGGFRTSLLYEKTTGDRHAKADGLGVLNYDDELLRKVPYKHEIAWFSMHDPAADYHAEEIVEDDGILAFDVVEKSGIRTHLTMHAIGIHNVYDALAAFAVGIRLGLERSVIAASIDRYRSSGVRQNLVEIAGRRVFLDCYSATEDSMRSVFATAKYFHVKNGGRKIVVVGDIPDLVMRSKEIHLKVGQAAHDAKDVDEIIFYGSMMKPASEVAKGGKAVVRHTASRRELESWLRDTSRDDIVAFKSSHKMCLHRVADDWLGTTFNLEDVFFSKVTEPVLEQVAYKNVEDYGACAVELCQVKKELVLPSSVEGMPLRQVYDKAFESSLIEKVSLPSPLISIGRYAFATCTRLKEVKLPDTLFYVGVGAFRDCRGLEEIEIPAGCATLDSDAFADCSALKRVVLPASLLTIGEGAFSPDCRAVFECVRDSYAEGRIRELCPHASILLRNPDPCDHTALMPDMDIFVKNDLVYTEDFNIDKGM